MPETSRKGQKSRRVRRRDDPPPYDPLLPDPDLNIPIHLIESESLRQNMKRELQKLDQGFINLKELRSNKYDHLSFEEYHLLVARMFTEAAYRATKIVETFKEPPI
ncbi:hypothetical protein N7509_002277 [Penicillium cosmopolitanum]|uniref:Uncharacterized protein n=1 Tax=Penicillium cosmopolitanum TaxID=1131564 RepID=A0A9W9W8S8_9EURO|nr:uncharacterized protein N7509_002277 [Penicillium cosmopolitanum]KAJ5408394.1 hypothetical protein N7509_002277 [Penicillium cosmopolitanum]